MAGSVDSIKSADSSKVLASPVSADEVKNIRSRWTGRTAPELKATSGSRYCIPRLDPADAGADRPEGRQVLDHFHDAVASLTVTADKLAGENACLLIVPSAVGGLAGIGQARRSNLETTL